MSSQIEQQHHHTTHCSSSSSYLQCHCTHNLWSQAHFFFCVLICFFYGFWPLWLTGFRFVGVNLGSVNLWLWVSIYGSVALGVDLPMHHSESTLGKLHHRRPENRPPPMMSEAGVVVTDPYGGVKNFPNNHTYCTDNTPRCPPFSGKL